MSVSRIMRGGWPLFLLGILLAGTPLYAAEDQPQVVRVFKVFNGASFIGRTRYRSIRLRLDGVEAPAAVHPEGLAAKHILEKMIASKRVGIRPTGPVRDQLLPVRVTYLDKDINTEMIRTGYAWVWPRDAAAPADLMAAERQARDAGKGVWAEPATLAPWHRLRD